MTNKINTNSNQILHCEHCGNKTVQEIVFTTESIDTLYDVDDPTKTLQIKSYYHLTKCTTCSGVSLFQDNEVSDLIGDLKSAYLVYPHKRTFGFGIPKNISEAYDEALKVEKHSAIAFSILIRRCLELLCKDKNAQGNNLSSQIKYLATNNIIPQTFVDISNTLRVLGNLSAHSDGYKIDVFEIDEIKSFTLALFEYVYILPARIKALNESIAKKERKN